MGHGGGAGLTMAPARHGGQQLSAGPCNCLQSLNCCILHDVIPHGGGEWLGGGQLHPGFDAGGAGLRSGPAA